jgi:hypothetical protein
MTKRKSRLGAERTKRDRNDDAIANEPFVIQCTRMESDHVHWFWTNAEVDRGTNVTVSVVRILQPFPRGQWAFLERREEKPTAVDRHVERRAYIIDTQVETAHGEEQADFVTSTRMLSIWQSSKREDSIDRQCSIR